MMTKEHKTEKDLKPLIDGDVLTYRCGFAADAQMKKDYIDQYFKEHGNRPSEEQIEEYLASIDYTAVALQNVKSVLEYCVERFNSEYQLFLHYQGNYRDALATIKPYKGNRSKRKPKYYDAIKDYMFTQWGAIPVNGRESDDAIGIEQFQNSDKYTVIVSIDKDMDTIPGWHYNWVRGELYYVTINEANRFFFSQMLTGDTTDNIPGIDGLGPKRTAAILEENPELDQLREVVKERYRKQYGADWERAYQEVGNLLYILRRPEEQEKGCPLL